MKSDLPILICPRNDEESLLIVKIAKALHIPLILSGQGHGARLELEPNLLERVKKMEHALHEVAIVEIPGPETERIMEQAGYRVHIIDHHRYNDLDRLDDRSSLEQFLELYDITDEDLKHAGFDPVLVSAVAAMDRGFLWEVRAMGLPRDQELRAMRYIKELVYELGFEDRQAEEQAAQDAWSRKREQGGILIVTGSDDEIDIRDAISYLIFDAYEKPTAAIIRQGNTKLYVQETDKAHLLVEHFGGFLFGKGRCWGMISPRDGTLPKDSEVLQLITS